MKIAKEQLERLAKGESPVGEWKVLDDAVIDHWRWGTVSQVVLEHAGTGGRYGYTYREQAGDMYWDSFEDLADGEEVEVYPVQTEMVIRYRRVE